jgi:hypothetical protein
MDIPNWTATCPENETVHAKIERELHANVYDDLDLGRAVGFAFYKLGYQKWRAAPFAAWVSRNEETKEEWAARMGSIMEGE